MTQVRYINKKTGWISVYESTSNYDPVTKTSRPKRKYIGHIDPVTQEFIPSTGKPGRKSSSSEASFGSVKTHEERYKQALSELNKQREAYNELKKQYDRALKKIEEISAIAEKLMAVVQQANTSS